MMERLVAEPEVRYTVQVRERPSDEPIRESLTDQLEAMYKVQLPEVVRRVVSLIESKAVFYDDRDILRSLSDCEILTASEDLSMDFVGKSLLPLFDIGDNDFIVFDLSENCWYLFNIADEVKFKRSEDILLYL
jgi:hypothetical protein